MSPVIPAEFVPFVTRELASGKYRCEADVVSAALRLLEAREQKLDALRADLQVGIDQLERGEYVEIRNEEDKRAFIEGLSAARRRR